MRFVLMSIYWSIVAAISFLPLWFFLTAPNFPIQCIGSCDNSGKMKVIWVND